MPLPIAASTSRTIWDAFASSFAIRNIFFGSILLVIIWSITVGLRRLVNRTIQEPQRRHRFRKAVTYAGLFASLAVVAFQVLGSIGGLAAIVGLIGAGVAVALQDVLKSLFAWPLIMGDKGFRTGDRIRCGPVLGDVIDIGMLRTTLVEVADWPESGQSTGRIIHVANKMILDHPLVNFTHGFDVIWHEVSILVTFESDWKEAERILYEAVEPLPETKRRELEKGVAFLQEKYLYRIGKTTPYVFISIEDSGVALTLRFLVEARARRSVHDRVCRRILEGIEASDRVDLAYPTYRIFRLGEKESREIPS
jgi:small-conductance mechanosensitive channel